VRPCTRTARPRLEGAVLERCRLRYADLSGLVTTSCRFLTCDLTGSEFAGVTTMGLVIDGAEVH
jgi:uncharacterized protein YjbI with pentapeptide repeats